MKKTIALLLALCVCIGLCACAGNDTTSASTATPIDPQNPTTQSPETAPSTEPPVYDPSMSELANSLRITSENYPRIDGSTSTLSIVQGIWFRMVADGTANNAAVPFPETASKTVPSYNRLINGEVDIIFVPYASSDVLKQAEEAGVGLEFHKIAAEALVFITPKENIASNITREQARSIYLNNEITTWSALGGDDRALIPLCRNADSGSQSQLDNLVLENMPMHPDIQNNYVELTMEGMLDQTAFYHGGGIFGEPTYSYALGYTLFSYLQNMTGVTESPDKLKMLAYEGVEPTRQTIADGSYPLADGYYAVVRSDLPEEDSAFAVISWLQGEDGIRLLEEMGLIPLGAQ